MEKPLTTLVMRDIINHPNSIFIEHVFIQQQGGGDWNENHSLLCHVFFPSETYDQTDEIVLWYGWNMGLDVDNDIEAARDTA